MQNPELHLTPESDSQGWDLAIHAVGELPTSRRRTNFRAMGLEDGQFLSSSCSEGSKKMLPPAGSELLKHHQAAGCDTELSAGG